MSRVRDFAALHSRNALQKADKQALLAKVSRSDFDSTTTEITKNLDELLEKLVGQVRIDKWQLTGGN